MPGSAPASVADLKGLIWTLVRTDFKVRYHRTVMGFLISPIVETMQDAFREE